MTATTLEFKKGETFKQTLSKGKSYSIADGKYEYSISGKDLVITKKEGEGTSEVTSKIVLKNYATKDVSDGVMVGENKLEDVASLLAIHRKNSFAGSRFADAAESTVKNETFKLGAGNDTITFDAKAGFGKDTVVLSKGENLTMSIMNGKAKYDAVSYNVKGNDVVVTADKVEYVLEAKAKGTIADLKPGKVVRGTHGANFNNETVKFTLNEYTLSQAVLDSGKFSDAQKALVGNYIWQSDFTYADVNYGTGKGQYEPCHVNLTNDDFAGDTITFDGVTYSDVKIYRVVNGVKTDITEEYKTAVKDASDYKYNKGLADKEFEGGSVVLKDFAKKDAGAKLTVNDVNLSEYVYGITSRRNSYTGSRLNEKATSTGANETFKLGTGNDTITFGKVTNETSAVLSDGDDTVILSQGEKLTLSGLNKENLTYSRKGNDITITNTITKEGAEKVVSTVKVKDYLKGKATVTVGTDGDLTKLLNESKSGFLTYDATKSNKAVKFTGTFLNETFKGSDKNDVINGGAGNDVITGGKGNDKLYGGTGENKFHFAEGSGRDVVYSAGEDTLEFDKKAELSYARKGNDVVITSTIKKDPIAVTKAGKGQFKFEDKVYNIDKTVKVTDATVTDETHVKVDNKVYDITNLEGKNSLAESDKSEDFTQIGGKYYANSELKSVDYVPERKAGEGEFEYNGYIYKKDKFVTKNADVIDTVTVKDYLKKVGQDVTVVDKVGNKDLTTILNGLNFTYGNAEYNKAQKLTGSFLNETFTGGKKADKIYTGAGTDTITAGAGNDTIYVNGEGTKTMTIGMNDGNDTIVMSSKADLKINFTLPEPVQTAAEGEGTEESSTPKAFKCATSYTRKGNDLIINNTYTGGDLTKDKAQTTTIKNYFKYEGATLNVDGKDVTTSKMSYQYTGSTKSDTYDFKTFDYAEVVVTDKKGNDIYNVDAFDKEIVINDKAGRDTLNLGMASKDVSLFFNVNANGKASGSLLMGSTVENALNGKSVEIANYFTKAGKIETITETDAKETDYVSIETRIDNITAAVQSWLGDNSKYNDAMDVLDSKNTDDIKSLMAVYTKGTYTKPETPVIPGAGA